MNNKTRQTPGLILWFFLTPVNLVLANPSGAQIVNGQVSLDSSTPGVLNITNSPNAIINWQDFSIGQNEITQFIQQNGQSAVLNQVIGQNPSQILGQLISNGHVFLINPNGIIFGANSMVDTQGLIASTLNLSNEDFLSGNYHFSATNDAGDILNQGIIRAGADGNIILIAPDIENNGIIQTDGGSITLAAGEELTLTNLDEPEIQFLIQAPENQVLNLGKVLTEGGAIDLFAGNITHSGELNANSIEVDQQGNIRLVALEDINLTETSITSANNAVDDAGNILIKSEQGTTLVSGQVSADSDQSTGGHIEILGHHVGLIEQAQISANGITGGGEILIGGDYKGQNTEIMNAAATYVGEQVSISADAIEKGDGGTIIVWSDEATRVYGNISATGGSESGDGGFVETSGHYLNVTTAPDVSAENGDGGTWLLDPYDITITAPIITILSVPFASVTDFTATSSPTTIEASVINLALASGDVIIDTNEGAGGEDGNVTFQAGADIFKNSLTESTFTINADGIIDLSLASITAAMGTGLLNINLISDRNDTGNGEILLGNFQSIESSGGTINLTSHSGKISMQSDSLISSIFWAILGGGEGGGFFSFFAGDIFLTADDMEFQNSNTSITSSSSAIFPGNVTIAPFSDTQDIFIGTPDAGLNLSTIELANISANILTIGQTTDTATLTVNTALTSTDWSIDTLSLKHENIVIDNVIDFSASSEPGETSKNLILSAATLVDINNAITTSDALFSVFSPTANLNPGDVANAININGTYAVTTTNMDGAGTIGFLNDYTLDTVHQSDGDLSSSNGKTVTIDTRYDWTGGTVSNNLIANGNTIIDGDVTLDGIFNNNGALAWNSGDVFGSTGTFNNNNGASFTINSDNFFEPSFLNAGTLTKTAGAGTTSFDQSFSNSGTVNANSGTLDFLGYTQTAGITELGGGNVTDSSGNSNFNGGILQGTGTYTVGSLNINPGATISPGNSPGILNIEGDLILNGTTLIEIEGLEQGEKYDFINASGDVSLGGTLVVATTPYRGQAYGDKFDIIQAGGSITGSYASISFDDGTNYDSLITEIPTFRLTSLFPPRDPPVTPDPPVVPDPPVEPDPPMEPEPDPPFSENGNSDVLDGFTQIAIESPLPYESETIDEALGNGDSDKAVEIEENNLKQCI